jgi:hypothetical protein
MSTTQKTEVPVTTDTTATTGTGLGAAPLVTPAPVVPVAATPVAPPVAGMEGLSLADRVVHEPEQIIRHEPILEKEVLREPTVQVQREHHIQPVIHETEHRIQPIIKTEATTERPVIVQDRDVMLEPVLERAALPAGLEPVERVAPEGVIHVPRVAKDVVVEHPVQIRHERHVQPIIHEREHLIQPIIKTEVTTEQVVVEQERSVVLPPIIEPPVVVDRGLPPVLPAAVPAGGPVVVTTTLPHSVGLTDPSQPLPQAPVVHRGLAPVDIGPQSGILDTEQALTGAGGAPLVADRAVPVVAPAVPVVAPVVPVAVGPPGSTTAETLKPTMGQRFKGAVKQLEGSLIGDEVKREEGKLIAEGVDPATAHSTAVSQSTAGTLL